MEQSGYPMMHFVCYGLRLFDECQRASWLPFVSLQAWSWRRRSESCVQVIPGPAHSASNCRMFRVPYRQPHSRQLPRYHTPLHFCPCQTELLSPRHCVHFRPFVQARGLQADMEGAEMKTDCWLADRVVMWSWCWWIFRWSCSQ